VGPLVTIGLLLLACLALSAFQCQSLCSSDTSLLSSGAFSPRVAISTAPSGALNIFVDVKITGVYSPALTTQQSNGAVEGLPTYLDELAQKGYLAIRVPHAPPTYPLNILVPGAFGSPAVRFRYYSPPGSPTATTVPVTVTRVITYEAIVNAKYPIADGHSHWEVWWVAGNRFPIPDQTFELRGGGPGFEAIEVAFHIDSEDPLVYAGAPFEALLYNGYTFIGPFRASLAFPWMQSGNPLAVFDQGCHEYATYSQYVTPTVSFTHTHWLGNYDTLTRTFTVTASSSQSWGYTYYYGRAGQPLQQAPGLPFTVEVGRAFGGGPGCLSISAVYTPTIAVSDRMRETFVVTATSVVSPTTVWAEAVSVALAPGYQLDEGGGFKVYLPLVLRNY
jgi:hypothetical protein